MTYRDGGSVFFSSISARVSLVFVFTASFINLILGNRQFSSFSKVLCLIFTSN